MAVIIDGKKLAQQVIERIQKHTQSLHKKTNLLPGLAVILIGKDPASQIYVQFKDKKAKECGFYSVQYHLKEETTQEEVLELIQKLNNDPKIHGILVQLPLPKHMNKIAITQAIKPEKDVDGFTYTNAGRLAVGDMEKTFLPCTPAGIMLILSKYIAKDLSHKNAIVIGRSNIVGKPIAQLLLQANATVTVAHSKTKNIEELCQKADIVIAAVGKSELIRGSWIKENAIVIDVGINRIEKSEASQYQILGDVHFKEAVKKAGFITPVPGGIGPMTIAMLMANTLKSACWQLDLPTPTFEDL